MMSINQRLKKNPEPLYGSNEWRKMIYHILVHEMLSQFTQMFWCLPFQPFNPAEKTKQHMVFTIFTWMFFDFSFKKSVSPDCFPSQKLPPTLSPPRGVTPKKPTLQTVHLEVGDVTLSGSANILSNLKWFQPMCQDQNKNLGQRCVCGITKKKRSSNHREIKKKGQAWLLGWINRYALIWKKALTEW